MRLPRRPTKRRLDFSQWRFYIGIFILIWCCIAAWRSILKIYEQFFINNTNRVTNQNFILGFHSRPPLLPSREKGNWIVIARNEMMWQSHEHNLFYSSLFGLGEIVWDSIGFQKTQISLTPFLKGDLIFYLVTLYKKVRMRGATYFHLNLVPPKRQERRLK